MDVARKVLVVGALVFFAFAGAAEAAALRLAWDANPETNIAGYRILYGTSSSNLSQTIQLSNPGLTSYVVENLAPGTYYFAVRAFTSSAESQLSNTASKIIQ